MIFSLCREWLTKTFSRIFKKRYLCDGLDGEIDEILAVEEVYEKLQENLKERFVLWIDFLGYREYMKKDRIFKVALILYYLEEYLEKTMEELCLKDFQSWLISDSLVVLFYEEENDEENRVLNGIIRAISNFQFFVYIAPNFYEFIHTLAERCKNVEVNNMNGIEQCLRKNWEKVRRGKNYEHLGLVFRGYLTFGKSGVFSAGSKTVVLGEGLAIAATREKNLIAPLKIFLLFFLLIF